MKTRQSILLALLILLSSAQFAGGQEPNLAEDKIPDLKYRPGYSTDYPAFVAAEIALDEAGELRPDLLSPSSFSDIERILKDPQFKKDGCVQFPAWIIEMSEDVYRQTFEQAILYSDWVFTAKVTGRKGGFSGSEAGMLYKILPIEALKGPKNRAGSHYIFLPEGNFQLGEQAICAQNHLYPEPPMVGEQVLLLVDLKLSGNGGDFLSPGGPTGIVTFHKDGTADLPLHYLQSEAYLSKGLDQRIPIKVILDRVRTIIESSEEK